MFRLGKQQRLKKHIHMPISSVEWVYIYTNQLYILNKPISIIADHDLCNHISGGEKKKAGIFVAYKQVCIRGW